MAKEKKGVIVAIDSKEARAKALEVALGKIEKDFGKGSVMKLGKKTEGVEVLPTGILSVDAALGVGGFPKGRIISSFGEGEMDLSTKIFRYLGVENPVYLGSSDCGSGITEEVA